MLPAYQRWWSALSGPNEAQTPPSLCQEACSGPRGAFPRPSWSWGDGGQVVTLWGTEGQPPPTETHVLTPRACD